LAEGAEKRSYGKIKLQKDGASCTKETLTGRQRAPGARKHWKKRCPERSGELKGACGQEIRTAKRKNNPPMPPKSTVGTRNLKGVERITGRVEREAEREKKTRRNPAQEWSGGKEDRVRDFWALHENQKKEKKKKQKDNKENGRDRGENRKVSAEQKLQDRGEWRGVNEPSYCGALTGVKEGGYQIGGEKTDVAPCTRNVRPYVDVSTSHG